MSEEAARLDELEKTVEALLAHVEALTQAVAGDQPETSRTEVPPWTGPLPEGDTLADWVHWFNRSGYVPAQSRDHIPTCWAEHPGLMAELHTLWHCWLNAFVNPDAEAEAAQNWHDRWLPGTLNRIRTWVPEKCLTSGHDTTTSSWRPPGRP